jgi:uncharacterized protein YkwD
MNEQDIELMLELHNKQRSIPLIINDKLMVAAQKQSQTMSRIRRLTHRGLTSRVKAESYRYRNVGENVAMGQTSVQQVMNSWLRSRGHARNIRGNFREVGFGRVGNYWCVIFATPIN